MGEIDFLDSESAHNPNAKMLLGTAAFEAANVLARSNPARAVECYGALRLGLGLGLRLGLGLGLGLGYIMEYYGV